jgi:hypothetical protein
MDGELIQRLLARLRSGTASSTELQGTLGASQTAVSRALRELADSGRVLKIGRARAARYGLKRVIDSIGSQWPLRRVTEMGDIDEIGVLFSLAADEYYLETFPGVAERGFGWGGLTYGLPYFLQDQRPDGFLGRAVPARYPELDLPKRVKDWSDDQYLRYLTLRGADAVSDLILGDRAFDLYLLPKPHPHRVPSGERARFYPALAEAAMSGEFIGSSAQGEHPKFTTLIEDAAAVNEVIVKFSPSMSTAVGRRWADLLIAEHHAHAVLRAAAIPTCNSDIVQAGGRRFLEVERFDRRGIEGRIGVSSLLAIDSGVIGGSKDWLEAAQKLHDARRIDAATLETVRRVSTFGGLIANTDRHFGNLAYFDRYNGKFELAPIYDMLPMLFAPAHDEIVERAFEPPELTSATLRAWPQARAMAEQYWQVLMQDERISAEFRAIAAACFAALDALPRTGPYAYALALENSQ